MSARKNKPIGTVHCPYAGCQVAHCEVFKFAQRAATDERRRFAGKLYGICPEHGRFGADGRPAMQDYILEHIEWPNGVPVDVPAEPESEPVAPVQTLKKPALPAPAVAPEPRPAPPAATPKAPRSVWEL